MVVAIIAILAGFGFVAVNRYQKRLKRVEMDNVAREIFVAAQNHLTASRAAGFWDGYVAQMEKDSSNRDFSSKLGKPVGNGSTDKQYVADQENRNAEASSGASAKSSDNVLKILLPYAAVDETLLTDGKYYIHYDAATASVLNVYYTDKDTIPEYDKLNETAKNDVSYRTEHGVGWYGTAAIPDTKPQSELKAPVMAVRNAESLVVYIIDPNYSEFKSGVRLEIAQTGQDGKAVNESVVKDLTLNSEGNGLSMGDDSPLSGFVQVQHVTVSDKKPITLADGSTANDYMLYAVVLDSITRKGGHFSQLFPKLTAGADITVTATVSSDQASGEAKSSVTTNSLFEALNNGNALISNARHLENLSVDISALEAQVTTAEITDDLYWNGIRRTKEDHTKYAPYTGSAEAFIDAIRRADWKYGYQSLDAGDRGIDGSTATVCVYSSDGGQWTGARKFAGIETATLTKLSGNDHVLTGFDIVADFAGTGDEAKAAPSGAGLFASTRSSFEINHLTVKNTRVYAAYTSGSSSAQLSAGTLVGNANGSVTLKDASAVTDCMRNGEIYKAGTYSLADGKSGLAADSTSGSGSQSTSVSLVENQISGVYSMDGIAGGLIGTAGGNLKIENSFASVPVYSAASSSGTGSNSGATGNAGIAGGLVGKVAGGTITGSFAGGYTEGSGSQGGSLSASSAGSGNSSASSSAAGTTSGTSITSTSNDYTSTTINVAAPNGIAGGLIGAVTGNLTTKETYTTTSVSASVGGGFVGVVSGVKLDLSKCYSTGRVFAKTQAKNSSGKFAGNVADNGSITSSGSLRAADASKSIAEVKNGVLAGTASSNGETSDAWTFPENLIGGETDSTKSTKSNPNTLQEIPAEDLAAVAGNDDFKAESQATNPGVLTYAYNSSLKGKDYPYPSYTSTSDNSSIMQFAGYTATGKTATYSKSAPIHYGDWVILRSNESKGVELVNDAVLRADVVVPDGVDTVTYIIIGKTSGSVQQIAVKKTGQSNEDGIGRIQIRYLTTYRNKGNDWNSSDLEADSSAAGKEYQDTEHGAWANANDPDKGTVISLFLDDLTTKGGQFTDMCPVLIPGENISVVTVTGENSLTLEEAKKYKTKYCYENWANQTKEEQNTHAETNSLFGSESTLVGKEEGTAGFYKLDSGNIQITNLRHLQNLEGDISNFRDKLEQNEHINNGGFLAQQKSDIDAARFGNMVKWIKDPRHAAGSYVDDPAKADLNYSIWKYGEQDTSPAFGKDNFYGIDNQWLMSYEGGNHIISRIKEKANGERNGGLFAIYYGHTLENLTLDRFEIKSAGEAAGTLAGATANVNSLMITNVLSADLQAVKSRSPAEVHSSVELTTQEGAAADSYAGGLIGKYDAQNSTLENCGAAVTVSGSASYAGGLVGGITKTNTVQNCYAAGKTYETHYEDQDGNPIYNVTGVKAAGGLIGYTEGLNNTSNNYSTASVKATDSNGYAGGLIGQSNNNADLTECYATGLVHAQDTSNAGLIAGTINGGNWKNICYLPKINVADMPAVPGKNDITVTALTAEEAADSITYRYDKTLPETYPYPMYATAGSSDGKKSHYGDWPEPIPPKSLDAEVTNDEVLYADLAPKKTGAELPSAITVLVRGETSGNYEQFVIKLDSAQNVVESVSRTGWKSRQVNDSDNNQTLQNQSIVSVTSEGKLRLILDDITGDGERTFAKVCPSLLPGEDIKVVAFKDAQPLDQESLVSYSSVLDKAGQHNSLFADDSSIGSGSESGNNQQVVEVQANVAKNRHLQNLDTAVSGINSDSNGSDANASALTVSAAVLDNDLDWATFASTVQGIKGETSASSEYTFRGIQDSKLTSLDGNGKTISNLTIQDGNQSEKNSGLFRTVSTNLAVSNLTLKNPSVQTTDPNANAGGLVGMHSGETLTIDNVGVLYDDDSSAAITASDSNGNAGGLVGMSSSRLSITDSVVAGKNMAVTSGDSASAGGLVGAHSAGTLTISSSAAAVYVQGGLAAGGVIGSADSAQGSKITNTYAGGHTVNGFYENSQDGEGRFNVRATAQAGNAGGLIGSAANLTVRDSYATASVYSSNAAGGFIGQAKRGTLIQSSYCTGLVKGTNLAGTFCGDNQSSSGSPVENPNNLGNVYLSGVNYRLMPVCGNDSSSQEGDSSAKLAKPASYYELEEEATSGKASPFDSTLGTAYPFIQRAIINGIVHYGDWPARQNVKDQYVVTFHYQDPEQSNAWVAVPEIAYYGKVEPVKVPHSEGQTFLGWYDAENGGSRIPDEAFENVTADMDVYARTARYISFYQYNPVNGQYSLEAKQVTIATTSDGNETVELPAATSYLSDWAFDGWYTKQNGKGTKLGGARESIKLYPNTKTALEESDYKAYAHYTKLTKYTITLHFRNQMAGQTDQEAIEDLKAEWYQDLVFEQSNGTELLSSGELPKSNVDSDTSGNVSKVYKAVDKNGKKTVEILQENQDGVFADGILSVNTKTNRYSITCDKEDEYSDQDYYLIYGDSTEASYTVKHVFEDSKEETKALFDVSGKLAMDISEVSYVKGENFTYTETLKGSVGSYTTAAALMTQEEAKEAEKAGQKVDRNRVLPEDFSGFEPKGVILQKKIANDGATVIEIHYVRKTYTLNYDLNSGLITTDNQQQKSYKASEAYEFGQTVKLPDNLTRTGYHLGTVEKKFSNKWAVVSKQDHDWRVQQGQEKYTAKDLFCDEELIMPAYNCYVIANWEANTKADIKIEIFQQKVTDQMNLADDKKEYDFYTSTTVKGVDTTKTLTVRAIMKLLENAASDSSNPLPDSTHADSYTRYLSYDHFGFNLNKYSSENGESPKANPDGTTVIKLYYDRDIMHFVFNNVYIYGIGYLFKQEVWMGLFDANFTNYKNSDGTLRYEWLHDNSKDQKNIYRPGNFSWKPGESKYTTDILTKFSLAATFGNSNSVYYGPDRNYVEFTAVGEIATSGKYRVYHYLEKDDSGRFVNQTSGLTSDLFESDPVNVIYSKEPYSYLFDPLYTGYELYGYKREKSETITPATLYDSFQLDNRNQKLYGYYIRLPYSIKYASVKNMDPSTYLFKDSVKKLSVPNPENWPDTVDPDDEFDGWYDSSDPEHANKIAYKDGTLTDIGKNLIASDKDNPGTMPSNNIQVFAHWKHANRKVTFNLNPGNRDGLDKVKVTYDYIKYTNTQSVEIEKGSSLTSLQAPDKDSIPAGEQFLYWYIVSDSNGEKTEIPIDRTFVINEDTTIYAKWAKDDMVTYTVRAMLYGEDGKADENLGKDVKSVVRGTSVTVNAPTVEGCRLVGGSKEGDYKLDEDTTFTFYYQKLPGAWEYTVRQYIEYTDIDNSSNTIRILFSQFTVPTTNQSVVVNAMDLLGKDTDGKMQAQLEYEYASIDGQKTNQKTIQVDQHNKVAEFVYRPSTELLGESLVDVHKKTETYDGTAKTVETPTINGEGKLLLTDVEGVSAKLSGEDKATYQRVNGKKENTDKAHLIHAGTYMETVPVQITYNNQTITVARISKVGLVIRPKDVIVTSRDAEILYTKGGVYQKKDIEGVKFSNDGFFESDSIQLNITYKWTDKLLQIGSVKNAFDCKLQGDNISDYNVTYKEGTLTVYWPLTVNHVLLYGPDTTEDGKPIQQQQVSLSTEQMDHNTDKTVTVSPLNLTPNPKNANDTETHWYGLEVSKKSSDNNNWQVSYNSESNEYSLKSADGIEVKYSRYDAEKHTYTVYYELPMLKGSIVVDSDGKMTFKDPTTEENAKAYEIDNEKLYAGAGILVSALNNAVSEQEHQNQTIMTRTAYTYSLVRSDDGEKLSLKLIQTVKTYQDTDKDGNLSEKEIKAQDQATDEASKPKVSVTTTVLRSVTIDAQQTSSGGQEAPASSSP